MVPRFIRIYTATLTLLSVGLIELNSGFLPSFSPGTEALAKSSGGRSGGGSFRSSPRSSGSGSSGGSYSNPSRYPGSSGYPSYPRRDPYDSYNRGPVIIPYPVGPSNYGNSGYPNYPSTSNGINQSNGAVGWLVWLLLLGVSVPVVFFIAYSLLRGRGRSNDRELDNDTVTVSKIQVALLAQAREIQSDLNRISEEIDTNTSEGLSELLQEAVLALLRSPENWSHALSCSQTVKSLPEGEALFSKWSIAERSKFSVETLTNVGGRKKRYQGFTPDPDAGPASYIVVTLLVGTAHDQPLLNPIHTTEELRDTLQTLASLPPDYLLVFELLWSPQEAADSLTYDELLTEYSDMVQI